MNSEFKFAVFDVVNDKITYFDSSSWDKTNINQNWQIATVDGQKFLYNFGAKMFATDDANSSPGLSLTGESKTVTIAQGDKAIKIGNSDIQWYLVDNDQLSAKENLAECIDGIKGITSHDGEEYVPVYNLAGQRLTSTPTKGIYIKNGKKVLVQ